MRGSLQRRLLLAASLVLAGFLGLTGWALDEAFQASLEQAMRDRLLGMVYALLAAAEDDARGALRLPQLLPDPRFNQPGSGIFAEVTGADWRWRSASLLGSQMPLAAEEPPGRFAFRELRGDHNEELLAVSYGVVWELDDGGEQAYTFSVAESLESLHRQLADFRRTLWGWLGGMALVLLAAQLILMRWSLGPLRLVARELKQVQEGQAEALTASYPREIHPLTEGLNALLNHLRSRETRYRDSMQDLAHSLKTPLAVLQSAAEGEEGTERLAQVLKEQVGRMNVIVQHQLARAAGSGRSTLAQRVPLAPVLAKLQRSLDKVYAEAGRQVAIEVPESLAFQGDEADLMEVLGNVLDNAYKHAEGRVRVLAQRSESGKGMIGLSISIEDDGPGIPEELRERVLRRGERGDQNLPGQGLGLTLADEILRLYGGRLEIGRSDLGGARIGLYFP